MGLDLGESPFLKVGGITMLSRLKDGRVMCSVCMEYTERDDLYVDSEGARWDVCSECGLDLPPDAPL